MKNEYDFSKGERGKFYDPDAKLNIPIYLEPDVADFYRKYAEKKNVATESLVNELLGKNIKVIQSVL